MGGGVCDASEGTPKRGSGMTVKIPMTDAQAAQLATLYEARQRADREFVLYATALLAGSAHRDAVVVGMEPRLNGTAPSLVVEVSGGE